jgi:hypothetical protein
MLNKEDFYARRARRKNEEKNILEKALDGGDLNTVSENGDTPLHIACKNENFDAVKTLVARGANIHARNNHQDTPLHVACVYNKIGSCAIFLVDAGAKINARNKDMETPLMGSTASNITKEFLDYFIKNGADTNIRDIEGHSLLKKFYPHSNKTFVQMLIPTGAVIDYKEGKEAKEYLGITQPQFDQLFQNICDETGNITGFLLKNHITFAQEFNNQLRQKIFGPVALILSRTIFLKETTGAHEPLSIVFENLSVKDLGTMIRVAKTHKEEDPKSAHRPSLDMARTKTIESYSKSYDNLKSNFSRSLIVNTSPGLSLG